MSARDATVARDGRAPTEAEPESGCATLRIGDHEELLSKAIRWVEPDGSHVIRSVEFDVSAGAATFEAALAKFNASLVDFAIYLGELDNLAENEEVMYHLLAPRVIRVGRGLERLLESRRKRLISVNLPRRRRSREDVAEWHPLSRQRGSQLPSPA